MEAVLGSDERYGGAEARQRVFCRGEQCLRKIAALHHKLRMACAFCLSEDGDGSVTPDEMRCFFQDCDCSAWHAVPIQTPEDRLVICHVLETLEEVLTFDFVQTLTAGKRLRRCRLCNRYFFPGDNRQLCCTRIYQNGRTCKQVWLGVFHHKSVASDETLAQFARLQTAMYFRMLRARDKRPGRYSGRDLTEAAYARWLRLALESRNRYLSGALTGEAFLEKVTPEDYRSSLTADEDRHGSVDPMVRR